MGVLHQHKVGYRRYVLCLLTLILALSSALAQAVRKAGYMDYIRTFNAEARRQMDRHAIPASITLAQGLVETGAGASTLGRGSAPIRATTIPTTASVAIPQRESPTKITPSS